MQSRLSNLIPVFSGTINYKRYLSLRQLKPERALAAVDVDVAVVVAVAVEVNSALGRCQM
jgi:hypothetical protein